MRLFRPRATRENKEYSAKQAVSERLSVPLVHTSSRQNIGKFVGIPSVSLQVQKVPHKSSGSFSMSMPQPAHPDKVPPGTDCRLDTISAFRATAANLLPPCSADKHDGKSCSFVRSRRSSGARAYCSRLFFRQDPTNAGKNMEHSTALSYAPSVRIAVSTSMFHLVVCL